MKQLIFKLFFTLLGGFFILYFVIPWSSFGMQMPFTGKPYKLGLDLQWWVELDYQVDLSQVETEPDYDAQRKKNVIEWLKSVIDKRIEALNINDSVITSASYAGEEHIIVQIPLKGNSDLENSENIQRAKDAIGKVVKIEFKEARDTITQQDIDDRRQLVQSLYDEVQQGKYDFLIEAERFNNTYENVQYGTTSDITQNFVIPEGTDMKWNTLNSWLSNGMLEVTDTSGTPGYLIYKLDGEQYQYIFFDREPTLWEPAKDSQGRVLDDRYFIKASVQHNEAFQPMVELTFNDEGAEIFWELTKRLIWEPIAIFVGWELLTAPTVNDAILSGKAVITGNYTSQEATKLANDINTWVVPAPIYLTSERVIDSRLGLNSLQKIAVAGAIGFSMIFVFLILIYRMSGFIAAIALFIYILIILGILKYFWIVLTLASIAGLILSIGIAIDANIIIFERIKDELKWWKDKQKAVKVGFDKSFTAIWDSNVTGLIVAMILFIFWINMIKWFGLILAIGILVSLFTVFSISRVFVRILSKSDIQLRPFIWYKK